MTNAERAQLAPSVHFDHHDPDFAKDPWPTLADLRSRCPVAHSETYGGFWVVTGYEDIRRVALDDATFSSAETILIPPKKNAAQKSIPIEMDAPEFLEYRKVMQPLFAPPAVERLAPVIEYYANHCIDQFIERGEVDVVHDFADPVPVMVTLHKLGMPIDDWRRYAEPMHKTVFLRQDNPARAGVLEELAWIAGTIKDAIQQRKQSPRDDMITYLLSSRPFGEPVSDHAAQEMIMLTMQGGFDTTGSAISSALLHLDRNRDDRRRLIEHPELMETGGRGVPPRRRAAVRARPHGQARRRARRPPDRARVIACCWSGRRATATSRCSSVPMKCSWIATRIATWRSGWAPTAVSARRWRGARFVWR